LNLSAKRFWYVWDKIGVLFILIFIAIVFGLLDSRIVAPAQLLDAISRASITGVAAAGMTLAICAGGFDLSVGSILSLVACIISMNIAGGMNTWLVLLIGIAAACVCGLINGLIITKLKIQTFVATLASQMAFAGVALVYTNAVAKNIPSQYGSSIRYLYSGKLFNIIPMPVIILAVVFAITYWAYKETSFGVKVRAIGSNEAAARTTGIKVDRTLIKVFIITGGAAALAAVLQVAKLSVGDPNVGTGWEINPITAVILGGTSLAGGRGNIWGTLIGAILVEFVKMGLNIIGVGEAGQKLAIAIVLIFALTISGIKLITQKEVLK
jgi:ribose/xylose/arabinose/galactoside ABC-type transport system permease subunit